MATVTLTLRCPRCGGLLTAPEPPSVRTEYFACPHCASPIPVVAPRDPPPLFSWEVFPHLYPSLPLPRPLGNGPRRVTVGTLLVATVLLVTMGAIYLIGGMAAMVPGSFSVGGTVEGTSGPLAGATVILSGENGFARTVTTGAQGNFLISSIPAGGVDLNVTASGYIPTVVVLFVSAEYTAAGGDPHALAITLNPGNLSAVPNEVTYSSFPDLESFVASLWSTTTLALIAGLVIVIGTLTFLRSGRPTRGVIAGATAVAAPIIPALLGVSQVYPWSTSVDVVIAALGATALTLQLIPMALFGRPPDYGPIG